MDTDELDVLFTEENCETIKIVEETVKTIKKEVMDKVTGDVTIVTEEVVTENEHIHCGYTTRIRTEKIEELKMPATDTTEAQYENRVTVSMARI